MRALIIVDVQEDFCEDGALAVEGGNSIATRIRNYVINWRETYDVIVATRDYHEPDNDNGGHFSLFPDYVDTWPVHCVQGTEGANLNYSIQWLVDQGFVQGIFDKGQGKPDYSGFQGTAQDYTLDSYLKEHDITSVDIVGIAGDHCVKATAIDAVNHGYTARILPDMVVSVGGTPATIEAIKAVDNLR